MKMMEAVAYGEVLQKLDKNNTPWGKAHLLLLVRDKVYLAVANTEMYTINELSDEHPYDSMQSKTYWSRDPKLIHPPVALKHRSSLRLNEKLKDAILSSDNWKVGIEYASELEALRKSGIIKEAVRE